MTAEQALRRYAAERDAEAFRVLVERYQGLVYSAINRLLRQREDVEDVTQQTFLKLAQGAGSIRENVGAWLYAAAVSGAMDRIRRDATRRRHEGRVVVERADVRGTGGVEWSEASVVVDEEIAQLPAATRELIVAHFLQGESHRMIAERAGVNSSTVTRRMEAAVRELRKGLARRGYGEAGAGGVGAMLTALPRATVPGRVSGELVKVGLAGTGKAAGWGSAMVMAWCAAIAVVVGGIFAVMWGMSGPAKGPVAVASVPATAPAATMPAAPPIPAAYLLDAGEELRRVRPPFPPERAGLMQSWGPRVSSTTFVQTMTLYENDGKLMVGRMGGGGATDAGGFARSTLRLYWYRCEEMNELPWSSSGEDWVVRGTLREEEYLPERLAAFAKIVSADIGKDVHFESHKVVRPCIIMKGKTHPKTLHEVTGIPTVVITLRTPTDADWERWKRHMPGLPTSNFQDVGWMLDAPWMPETWYVAPAMNVAPDAHLKRTDPDYKEKLAKVLENVQAQVGAEWSIEDREIDVWRPVVK